MVLDLPEQINDVIRTHPNMYYNFGGEPTVPHNVLSEIMSELFIRFGVEMMMGNEENLKLMDAYVRANPDVDVTPGFLLQFDWVGVGYARYKERILSSSLLHHHRTESEGSLGGPSILAKEKRDKSNDDRVWSGTSSILQRPRRRIFIVQNPDPSSGSEGEEQLSISTPHSAPAGNSSIHARHGEGSRVGNSSSFGGETQWRDPTPHSASAGSSSVTHLEEHAQEIHLDGELLATKSSRGILLQRIPNYPRKSQLRRASNLFPNPNQKNFNTSPKPTESSAEDQRNFFSGEVHHHEALNSTLLKGNSQDGTTSMRDTVSPSTSNVERERGPKSGDEIHHLSPQSSFDDFALLLEYLEDSSTASLGRRQDSEVSDISDTFVLKVVNEASPSTRPTSLKHHTIPNLSSRVQNIRGPLRSGGFCDIYMGELRREGRADNTVEPVAMKMLRVFGKESHVVRAKKKFRREVDVWRSLCHPNVLTFYGTCEIEENRLYMVSPWASGGSSLEYLRQNPKANRGRILQQTSCALEYLHCGKDIPQVVHGDLKADNVLISETGDALLCDFGLSCYAEEVMTLTGTSSASIAGQIRFMAPELINPPKNTSTPSKPTPASDVFAFASLALQIYTEKPPFSHLREAPAMFAIVNGVLPLRPTEAVVLERGFHEGVWTWMTDCWQSDARKRPTMKEVASRLIELT